MELPQDQVVFLISKKKIIKNKYFIASTTPAPTASDSANQNMVNTLQDMKVLVRMMNETDPNTISALAGVNAAIAYFGKIRKSV